MNLIQRLFTPVASSFNMRLYCKNCGCTNSYTFPKGTSVNRAPYLGYEYVETQAILPDGERKMIKCRRCGIGNVA